MFNPEGPKEKIQGIRDVVEILGDSVNEDRAFYIQSELHYYKEWIQRERKKDEAKDRAFNMAWDKASLAGRILLIIEALAPKDERELNLSSWIEAHITRAKGYLKGALDNLTPEQVDILKTGLEQRRLERNFEKAQRELKQFEAEHTGEAFEGKVYIKEKKTPESASA